MRAEGDLRWVPIRELGEIRGGKQLSPSSREGDGQFPYLRVANVFEGWIDYSDVKMMSFTEGERKIYGLRVGDILLNEGQSLDLVGRSSLYDGPEGSFCFQNTLLRFRAGDRVIPAYAQIIFRKWLSSGVFASIAKKTTSIAHLGGDRFGSLLFPVIPLCEQRRIVEVLNSTSLVERSIMTSTRKLYDIRRGVLMASMNAAESATSRQGWVRGPLAEFVPTADYGISEALGSEPDGIPVLRMNNIRDGRIDVSDLRFAPSRVPERLTLRPGDVLFNRTNSIEHVGKAAMWRDELPEATFASYLVRLNPDLGRIVPEYLVEWLAHPLTRQRVKAISTVAVQQVNVNPTRLRELEIDLPIDLEEQRRIVRSLAACDDRIRREEEELAKLRQLKIGLTEDLLAGA
ncbi:restriction endonuclease subunit S [Streptomyces sp. NPDC006682]|uniref:restriction endonuclease subunit S n=1 Tax=Streptomyces TaxID=1883 RepID=UPI000A9F8DC7|nr:restriction endonuclease subunit S [[Kitasatospora] papulosa]